jgi:hypothetical protein
MVCLLICFSAKTIDLRTTDLNQRNIFCATTAMSYCILANTNTKILVKYTLVFCIVTPASLFDQFLYSLIYIMTTTDRSMFEYTFRNIDIYKSLKSYAKFFKKLVQVVKT